MFFLVLLATFALSGITLIAILNALTFPRLRAVEQPPGHTWLPVSVLIPARNEAHRIGATVQKLLLQDYPNFEIIILDDHSSDDTKRVAAQAAGGDRRLKILPGTDLPAGWSGKNWACQQLGQAAQGELLLFTDADVDWAPGSLRSVVSLSARLNADLLTVWPTQLTTTCAERLVVPLISLAIIAYLPLLAVHHIPWRSFAAANGQCLLFRRHAYQQIGGHQAVRESIIDDISLAKCTKAAGLKLRMADGAGLISCRMYPGWEQVRDGFAKNILAGHGGHLAWLLLSTLFHWLIFLAPWLWLGLGWLEPAWPGGWVVSWPWWPLCLVSLGIGARLLSALVTRQRPGDALLLPLSVILMTRIALQSAWWQIRYGGPLWKDRRITAGSGK